jgi:hypothetical protein
MQYYGESASVCRNKTLQKMFMLIGSAEKAGSGVDKILAGWRFANWRAPMLRTLSQPDLVELTMMMDEGTKDRLVRIFGTEVFSLGHERLLTLNAACTDGYITNENLRVVLNQHKAEVADLLKDMCKHKLLVQEGYGRGTKYRLPMTGNIASSEPNIASSEPNIASTRVKQRMPYQSLKAMICTVCSEWISLDELSAIVRRDKIYLRNFIIPKMLEDNSLEMLFPGVPNHPRQKYTSTVNK